MAMLVLLGVAYANTWMLRGTVLAPDAPAVAATPATTATDNPTAAAAPGNPAAVNPTAPVTPANPPTINAPAADATGATPAAVNPAAVATPATPPAVSPAAVATPATPAVGPTPTNPAAINVPHVTDEATANAQAANAAAAEAAAAADAAAANAAAANAAVAQAAAAEAAAAQQAVANTAAANTAAANAAAADTAAANAAAANATAANAAAVNDAAADAAAAEAAAANAAAAEMAASAAAAAQQAADDAAAQANGPNANTTADGTNATSADAMGANATATIATVANSTDPLAPPPPCNWTLDQNEVVQPANCTNDEQGDVRCAIVDTFPPPENCTLPVLLPCMNLPNLGLWPPYYKALGSDVNNGAIRKIQCADEATPTDTRYDFETWGTDKYPGVSEAKTICRNGTWSEIKFQNMAVTLPKNFTCYTKAQIQKLKDVIHYEKETMLTYNDTMTRHYPWIDGSANLRKDLLLHAQFHARRMEKEAKEENKLPTEDEIDTVINGMIDNYMKPRGVTFSKDTCAFLEKQYFAPEDPGSGNPPHVKCTYAVHQKATSWDYMNAKPVMFYRHGCKCESYWQGGCPWRIDLKPTYQAFGFTSMEKQFVSDTSGSPYPNWLCWYWSNPTYPEWGFLNHTA